MDEHASKGVGVQVIAPVALGDLTVLDAARRLGPGPGFVLDSALPSARLGRFSFAGGSPVAVVRAWRRPGRPPGRNARVQLDVLRDVGPAPWGPEPTTVRDGDFYRLLGEVLAAFTCTPPAAPAVPLVAGAVGYVGYGAGHFTEAYPDTGVRDVDLPDVHLLLVDAVVSCDHATGQHHVGAAGWGATTEEATAAADARLREVTAALQREPGPAAVAAVGPLVVERMFTAERYSALVEEIKEHLRGGDAYEVCLTHRLEAVGPGLDPWALYEALRVTSPAPFAAYLDLGDVHVLSSSPERFLAVDRDGRAESRPIKGTRPRAATPEEDAATVAELRSSPKDRAENVMIVDLVRNDFGRVCRPGTIEVDELCAVESYRTVHQLVSTVTGRLADGAGGLDLLRACFPPGSMTGAPKIAAMEIIDRLEPVERGVYSGAIGYFDFSGPVDLSVVIRTLVLASGRCTFGVGGAIVIDSDPAGEFAETMDKARAIREALRRVAGGGCDEVDEVVVAPP